MVTDLKTDQLGSDSFVFYPNPTEGEFYIKSNVEELSVTLYDLFGRNLGIIKSMQKGEQSIIQMNLDNFDLKHGIYILDIKSGDKRSLQKLEYRKE